MSVQAPPLVMTGMRRLETAHKEAHRLLLHAGGEACRPARAARLQHVAGLGAAHIDGAGQHVHAVAVPRAAALRDVHGLLRPQVDLLR